MANSSSKKIGLSKIVSGIIFLSDLTFIHKASRPLAIVAAANAGISMMHWVCGR